MSQGAAVLDVDHALELDDGLEPVDAREPDALGLDDALELDDEDGPKPEYGRPMSLEAWEDMDEDIPGELVDGRLEGEEVADFPHEVVVALLLRALFAWDVARRAVILASEAKYALSKSGGRKPDISVYLTLDRKLPRRGANRVPPDIMVEIVSRRPRDRRRDRVEKLREYAAFGVRWYWLVDPEARTFEILGLDDDRRYVHVLDVTKGVVEIPGCAGLTLDLDALWLELDAELEEEGFGEA